MCRTRKVMSTRCLLNTWGDEASEDFDLRLPCGRTLQATSGAHVTQAFGALFRSGDPNRVIVEATPMRRHRGRSGVRPHRNACLSFLKTSNDLGLEPNFVFMRIIRHLQALSHGLSSHNPDKPMPKVLGRPLGRNPCSFRRYPPPSTPERAA